MAAPHREDLPILELFPQLEAAWRRSPVVLVKAPTGSGKSTRLPLHLLQWEGFPRDQLLVVLQPRRVAARLLARYLAGLLGERPGETVGYQVRFERQRSKRTRLLFVTEGLLLRWLAGGTGLSGVGGILFDEFHERHLEGDVGLGLALRAQEAGWGGRIGILSATLETTGLRRLLPEAEVLESAGRSFSVATELVGGLGEERPAERVVKAVRKALREGLAGDYLVFLPGAGDIERAARGIRELREAKGWEVLPLYGALPPEAQDRALCPGTGPRILVATNLAETSVTLPGIRTVIDSGLARMPAYDQRRGVNTLLVEPISRASAEQRAGRAGRVAPGTCLRLWTRRRITSAVRNRRPRKSNGSILRRCGCCWRWPAAGRILLCPSRPRMRPGNARGGSFGSWELLTKKELRNLDGRWRACPCTRGTPVSCWRRSRRAALMGWRRRWPCWKRDPCGSAASTRPSNASGRSGRRRRRAFLTCCAMFFCGKRLPLPRKGWGTSAANGACARVPSTRQVACIVSSGDCSGRKAGRRRTCPAPSPGAC
ncbi:MAG: hypothetical protein GVY10_04235 [Verrucomicrobia bacterium]|nr:hypothetical protein [Verrucomicrobiota bacterium]